MRADNSRTWLGDSNQAFTFLPVPPPSLSISQHLPAPSSASLIEQICARLRASIMMVRSLVAAGARAIRRGVRMRPPILVLAGMLLHAGNAWAACTAVLTGGEILKQRVGANPFDIPPIEGSIAGT